MAIARAVDIFHAVRLLEVPNVLRKYIRYFEIISSPEALAIGIFINALVAITENTYGKLRFPERNLGA